MDHWCHTDVTHRLYPEVTAYRWHRCKSWSGTTFHDRIAARGGEAQSAGMHAIGYYGVQCHRRLHYLESSAGDRPHTRAHTCVRKRSRRPILCAWIAVDGIATLSRPPASFLFRTMQLRDPPSPLFSIERLRVARRFARSSSVHQRPNRLFMNL